MENDIRHQTSDIRATTGRAAGKRKSYSFRDLAVWQRSQELSLLIVKFVRGMPSDRASAVLGQQVLRSTTSIAANIAEGHGRYTPASYRNHLSIARSSTTETMGWLDLLHRAGYLSKEVEQQLLERCEEIMRMISAQMIALDRKGARAST